MGHSKLGGTAVLLWCAGVLQQYFMGLWPLLLAILLFIGCLLWMCLLSFHQNVNNVGEV